MDGHHRHAPITRALLELLVSQSRQDLADNPRIALGLKWHLASITRYWLRRIAYRLAPLTRRFEPEVSEDAAQEWNNLLRTTSVSTYLGNTIDIDTRNHIVSTLLRYRVGPEPSVLDIGCCGGTLVGALTSYSRYLGLDISAYAIDEARRDPTLAGHISSGKARFETVDLRSYDPTDRWDVIIFSEVLYYLTTDTALDVVLRYARFLSPSGVLVVSMKDDGKSAAIFSQLSRYFTWIDGVLWQRKPVRADFSVRVNRECPGDLVGVLAPAGRPARRLS